MPASFPLRIPILIIQARILLCEKTFSRQDKGYTDDSRPKAEIYLRIEF